MHSSALTATVSQHQGNGLSVKKVARMPRGGLTILSLVLLLCITPLLLNLLGIYFDSPKVDITELLQLNSGFAQLLADQRMLMRMGAGAAHHTLLEWTAVMLAFLTALMAFAHFRLDQENIATPIIGIALCCSGVMDAFHILVSLNILSISANDGDFVPVTWALARGFNAVILIIGAVICLRLASITRLPGEKKNELFIMLGVSAVFAALALLSMFWAASSQSLPQAYLPDALLRRPLDIVAIALFIFALCPLVALYRKMPTMLHGALIVCVIPQVVLELHMAFGSTRMFDNHFNIAHVLKIVAYLVPFIGLVMHYFQSYTKIDHALYHDALTGTANRIYFFELAKRSLAQAQRRKEQVALFYMDVNRFKEINDTYGHDVGDKVLVKFAQRMQALTRTEDCFARLAGDEFVLLLDHFAHVEHLETVAEKIIAVMQEPISTSAGDIQANVSIGISLFPDSDNLPDLVKHADLAMYEAKARGDSSYQVYTAALSSRHSEEISMQRAMPKGLQAGHMHLVYQPIFDAKARVPVAFEALLRWDDPQRGRISPDIFIPIAEKTNFISTLGLWVFDQACAQLAEWQQSCTRPLQVHINMSARQFHNKRLALQVANIIYTHQLDGRSIVIEITEGQLIEDIDKCKETIAELKRMGITIALDDYGSGFASITHLRELPIDHLKIDRCLIQNSPHDNQNRILTKTTIELAHSLGLKVVAEGIETKAELRLIRQLGCNYAQGFFLARPLSAKACAELLRPPLANDASKADLAMVGQLRMNH